MKTKVLLLPILAVMLLAAACSHQLETMVPELIDPYTYEPKPPSTTNLTLATNAYQKADYENAARYYLAHLTAKPDDATAWYNLSCCYGLLGRADLAGKYLMQSYKAGYRDLQHAKGDKDFDAVRDSPEFTAAQDSLRVWDERRAWYEGETKYVSSTHLMPYQLHLPRRFSRDQAYTLVIGMHGYGDTALKFSGMWRHLENDNVIFVVPEAPYPLRESFVGFSWGPSLEMKDPLSLQASEMLEEYILALTEQLGQEYNISSTWLLGFSQGAYTGFILSLRNPNVFDGLLACGGGLLTDYLTKDQLAGASQLKIVVSHGRQDKIVPYSEAEQAMKIFAEYEYPNVYLDAFDGGHSVSPGVFTKFREWKGK